MMEAGDELWAVADSVSGMITATYTECANTMSHIKTMTTRALDG